MKSDTKSGSLVVEPWTKFKCSICDTEYHLIDGAGCECGKEEADKLYKKHIKDTRWGL